MLSLQRLSNSPISSITALKSYSQIISGILSGIEEKDMVMRTNWKMKSGNEVKRGNFQKDLY
jgi:hypothetical protein